MIGRVVKLSLSIKTACLGEKKLAASKAEDSVSFSDSRKTVKTNFLNMFTPCKIKEKTAEHVSSFIKSNKPSLWFRYDIRYYCFLLPSWLEDWKSRDVWEAHHSHTECVSQAICYWKNVSKWNNISITHIDMSVIKYLNPIEGNATAILEDKIIVPSQHIWHSKAAFTHLPELS